MILTLVFATSLMALETDYCQVNSELCDKDGIYKYKWMTSYEDFVIREVLDKDLQIMQAGNVSEALKQTQTTLEQHSNR